MNDETPDSPPKVLLRPAQKRRFWASMRTNFLTGVVIGAPISITIYLTWVFVNYVDNRVVPLIPDNYNPENYLPFSLPGLGLVVFFFFTAALGAFAKNFFGRQLFAIGERMVDRMPVVRSLYLTLKQIIETIFKEGGGAASFRQVCLVEYPRKGIWAIAFITTDTHGEIPMRAAKTPMVSVFLPTTPNPTSGFLLFLPKEDVQVLDMSVEDGAKLVISAGLVSPNWDPAAAAKAHPAPPPEEIYELPEEDEPKKGFLGRLFGNDTKPPV